MANWLELRRNYTAYYDFYTYLLSSIVGKRNFKIRLNTMAEGEEISESKMVTNCGMTYGQSPPGRCE
jgi:hypothetical protein